MLDLVIGFMEQANVLYDFEGLQENNEISLKSGETVTILNKEIGDGWWEGKTSDGRKGYFPEAYVEIIPNYNSPLVCFIRKFLIVYKFYFLIIMLLLIKQ